MFETIKEFFYRRILCAVRYTEKSIESVGSIIQGGMGVGVSGWKLARAVALAGGVGTVSGTAVVTLFVDTLQKGDPGKHLHRALKRFPFQSVVKLVLDEYYVKGGIKIGEKQNKTVPMWSFTPHRILIALTLCANFSYVWLAKEGHNKPIFINFLEKAQLLHPYQVLGAMLANVDGIVMGAGIPKKIPALIDAILEGKILSYPVHVKDYPFNKSQSIDVEFDPIAFFGVKLPKMFRPLFFPIVSSHALAKMIHEANKGKVDGFIVEDHTAGGHNAPPRGEEILDDRGQPVYGIKDKIDTEKFVKIGLPFWLAGSLASPEGFRKAQSLGARGIQVGTVFAFCEESGIEPILKRESLSLIYRQENHIVFTSPLASSTTFPIKVLLQADTLSVKEIYDSRVRKCNLGYLREPVWFEGKTIFRCRAEPETDYRKKGGNIEETRGRVCLCCALCATAGVSNDEVPILTVGDDLYPVCACIDRNQHGPFSYSAEDVMNYLREN